MEAEPCSTLELIPDAAKAAGGANLFLTGSSDAEVDLHPRRGRARVPFAYRALAGADGRPMQSLLSSVLSNSVWFQTFFSRDCLLSGTLQITLLCVGSLCASVFSARYSLGSESVRLVSSSG